MKPTVKIPRLCPSLLWRSLLVALNLRDRHAFDMYRVDLETGAITLEATNPGDVLTWTTDNDFVIRAATAFNGKTAESIIRVRDDPKSPWRELIKWGPDETFGGVNGFSPDDKALWVTTSLDVNAARRHHLARQRIGAGTAFG